MHCFSPRLRSALLYGLLSFPFTALPDEAHWEFLLFPEATAYYHSPAVKGYGEKPRGLLPAADLFVTSISGPVRFLAEVLLSDQERELERFQLGYQLGAARTLWLGRFHSPIGYWNSTYHHGSHLQATILRPALIDYEDKGGVIPSHLSGLLWDQRITHAAGELRWMAAAGAAPELGDHTLQPYNLLDRGAGRHRDSAIFRVSYKPDDLAREEYGLSYAYTDIATTPGHPLAGVRQNLVSVYFDRDALGMRWLFEGYLMYHDTGISGSRVRSTTRSAYLQIEHQISDDNSVYARGEATDGAEHDAYLQTFPMFIQGRGLFGLRHELSTKQAIKLELCRSRSFDVRYNSVMLQWSAAYP